MISNDWTPITRTTPVLLMTHDCFAQHLFVFTCCCVQMPYHAQRLAATFMYFVDGYAFCPEGCFVQAGQFNLLTIYLNILDGRQKLLNLYAFTNYTILS
jgi:hypothetical protein